MKGRAEWLEWRAEGIGASEAAVACGLEVHGQTRFDLWARKTGKVPDVDPTERMRWGLLLEPVMVEEFTRQTGLHVSGEQTWCQHPAYPHHRCTVDGFVSENPHPGSNNDDILGVLELKTGQARWEDIPDAYTIQVQWQLWVTGHAQAWVAYLRSGYDFTIHEVERDDELIARIVDGVERFWHDHVLEDVPPQPTGSSNVQAVYPQSRPAGVELTGEAIDWYDRGLALRRLIAVHDDELIECRRRLEAAMGEADTATIAGQPALTWKTRFTTGIDTKALEADLPEVAEKYRITRSTRTFLWKDVP